MSIKILNLKSNKMKFIHLLLFNFLGLVLWNFYSHLKMCPKKILKNILEDIITDASRTKQKSNLLEILELPTFLQRKNEIKLRCFCTTKMRLIVRVIFPTSIVSVAVEKNFKKNFQKNLIFLYICQLLIRKSLCSSMWAIAGPSF